MFPKVRKRGKVIVLTARKITKSFGKTVILKNVDIDVEPGKITALVGPSGSGKTTLIKALSLLDIPDSGRVTVDEISYEFPVQNNTEFSSPWPKVTVVFQGLFLWPHMTLRKNITFPLRWNNSREIGTDIEHYIELFDMADFIDRFPNQASVGQRQRAAIVRALMLKPKYILFDEITSALDVEQVSSVLSCVQTLREHNIGVLVVTHLLGFARRAADYVAFIDEGSILESGGREVLETPRHERVKRFLSVIESAR
jgi:L-cystine transport system ATP-binding protein